MRKLRPLTAMVRLHRRQGGQVFVFVVLLLTVIAGMAATAVDLGSYALDRRDLQNAADAIALAASQELPNADNVQSVANQWATKNHVDPSTMTVTITQQSLPDVPNPKVQITVRKNHGFTFARLIGITSSNVQASGSAIRTSPGGSAGLVPWSVQKSVLTLVPPGTTTTLKYDSNNPANGNFGAIRIDGNGGSVYRDTVEFGSQNGLCATGVADCSYPSSVSTETGNMVGPTRTAVDYIMNNTTTACDTWAEVTLITNGKTTLNPACNPFVSGGNPASLRVILIPVISNPCNGNCNVTITEFALFFLEGYGTGGCNGNHCDIQGRFINSNTNYNAQVGVFDANTLAHFVKLVQ